MGLLCMQGRINFICYIEYLRLFIIYPFTIYYLGEL